MAGDQDIFIVDGQEIINTKIMGYRLNMDAWKYTCSDIFDSFTQKTSTVATNKTKDHFKEYTYWYRKQPDGTLESYGKERPDIESMYPPKPENPIQFEHQVINHKHIILSKVDFENNSELFGPDCYIFPFSALLGVA